MNTAPNTGVSQPSASVLYFCFALLALAVAGAGAILLTEVGQVLNLPRSWVTGYFRYRGAISVGIVIIAGILLYAQLRRPRVKPWQAWAYLGLLALCLFIINWFVPYFWLRAEQHDAQFVSVAEADGLLSREEDVFVLVINGDARAYPRDSMMLPHIAGDSVGGEDVVMTYCALSNLPQAFSTDIGGQQADYRVIAQVNSNLIFTDTNSGELFQQITGTGEYEQARPEQFPVQRMPWHAFKSLYPEGQVFVTQPNVLDRITSVLFEQGLDSHYDGSPLFPTLSMGDQRLPSGEPIWGMTEGEAALAVANSLFEDTNIVNTSLGGRDIVLAWFPEHDTLGAFYRGDLTIEQIDPYGMLSNGQQLERVKLYPGVLWMVWSHWFPQTELLQ